MNKINKEWDEKPRVPVSAKMIRIVDFSMIALVLCASYPCL
nr:MAG TPA: hypothetical protein [Caudoviricetes sp.]